MSTTTTELQPGLVYFGLGANLGDRERTLRLALEALARRFPPLRTAGLYRSAPVVGPGGPADQPDYLNTAAVGRLGRPTSARAVLAQLKELERRAGRVHPGPRDGPRALDIDLLLAGPRTLDLPALEPTGPIGDASDRWPGSLVLPHPRLVERRFVLLPLFDLDPDLSIPPAGKTVREHLAELGEDQAVERVPWEVQGGA
ncbi:MAG: 2-amino-4-hydroxy-6-hydroxymethyldihydropteridine diphosphokinase [Acidobacteriota bacterium]